METGSPFIYLFILGISCCEKAAVSHLWMTLFPQLFQELKPFLRFSTLFADNPMVSALEQELASVARRS